MFLLVIVPPWVPAIVLPSVAATYLICTKVTAIVSRNIAIGDAEVEVTIRPWCLRRPKGMLPNHPRSSGTVLDFRHCPRRSSAWSAYVPSKGHPLVFGFRIMFSLWPPHPLLPYHCAASMSMSTCATCIPGCLLLHLAVLSGVSGAQQLEHGEEQRKWQADLCIPNSTFN